MINLIDMAGVLSMDEFLDLKNFIVDKCLCTPVETSWLDVKIRKDGNTSYLGYWTATWETIGLDLRNVKATIILNATYLLTVDQMKEVLAHEYGHHWTIGYFIETLETPGWFDHRAPMDYYRMRGLSLTKFAKDYSNGWEYCDKEVLAEDYKYFFSPFTGKHRMRPAVGNPSQEVKAKILDYGMGRRKSWDEIIRDRF